MKKKVVTEPIYLDDHNRILPISRLAYLIKFYSIFPIFFFYYLSKIDYIRQLTANGEPFLWIITKSFRLMTICLLFFLRWRTTKCKKHLSTFLEDVDPFHHAFNFFCSIRTNEWEINYPKTHHIQNDNGITRKSCPFLNRFTGHKASAQILQNDFTVMFIFFKHFVQEKKGTLAIFFDIIGPSFGTLANVNFKQSSGEWCILFFYQPYIFSSKVFGEEEFKVSIQTIKRVIVNVWKKSKVSFEESIREK